MDLFVHLRLPLSLEVLNRQVLVFYSLGNGILTSILVGTDVVHTTDLVRFQLKNNESGGHSTISLASTPVAAENNGNRLITFKPCPSR